MTLQEPVALDENEALADTADGPKNGCGSKPKSYGSQVLVGSTFPRGPFWYTYLSHSQIATGK